MTEPVDPLHLLSHNVPENPEAEGMARDTWALLRRGAIVVPWSGGLDSTTAAMWAISTRLPVTLLAITANQPWDSGERRARSFIRQAIPELAEARLIERQIDTPLEQYGHIQAGRNFAIADLAMEVLTANYGWGEVWMAWVEGEIPNAIGDKSRAGLAFLQAEYVGPFRFHVPTAHHTKGQLVRWWQEQGRLEQAVKLYSCFEGGTVPCGHCQACWRFWAAFAVNRAQEALPWNHRIDFGPHVAKYRAKVYDSKARAQEDLLAINRYEQQRRV